MIFKGQEQSFVLKVQNLIFSFKPVGQIIGLNQEKLIQIAKTKEMTQGETHLNYLFHPVVLQAAFIILAVKYFLSES
jgi:hypothetical protein